MGLSPVDTSKTVVNISSAKRLVFFLPNEIGRGKIFHSNGELPKGLNLIDGEKVVYRAANFKGDDASRNQY